ncbi:ATP-binding protein [Nakamurella sp. A5-74]|uniref:ATP-binding protein n=1 Tax=Nakamurella sp. A5-74 TaxID=3158264 RepID=A0AAU8DUI2_9ACTN
MLCGRSLSGKSTLARQLADALPATVIALDHLNAERGLSSGAGIPLTEWGRTHEIAHDRTRTELLAGRSVVVDDTSSPRFLRDRWRDVGREAAVPVTLVYLDTPIEVSAARHAVNRSDPVRPDVADRVLRDHLDGFEPPELDEDAIRVAFGSPEGIEVLLRRIRVRR